MQRASVHARMPVLNIKGRYCRLKCWFWADSYFLLDLNLILYDMLLKLKWHKIKLEMVSRLYLRNRSNVMKYTDAPYISHAQITNFKYSFLKDNSHNSYKKFVHMQMFYYVCFKINILKNVVMVSVGSTSLLINADLYYYLLIIPICIF